MKFIILILSCILLISCSSSKELTKFDQATSHHQRIAIIPLQSTIKLKEKEKTNITESQLQEMEVAQAKDVQDAIESYLIDKDIRVSIQSANMTNSKLKQKGIDLETISEQDYTVLASHLEVDAIVAGEIETEKPMDEKMATGLDIAKDLEKSILGSSFGGRINTSTNKGYCKLNLYDGTTGDRLWSYNYEIELKTGSTTQDMINVMMKKGAKTFPY